METAFSRRINLKLQDTWSETKKQFWAIERRAAESIEEGLRPLRRTVDDRVAPWRKKWNRLPKQIEATRKKLDKRAEATWKKLPTQIDGWWASLCEKARGAGNLAARDEIDRLQARIDELTKRVDRLASERGKVVRLPRK